MCISEGEMMSWLEIGVVVVGLYWLLTGPFNHARPKGSFDGAWRVME
tara:strand:+ start:1133 stop:1273 length:141 start_codon:yes stop_codon:yes gene_type:complete